jgi:excisionase family DNA binding protein
MPITIPINTADTPIRIPPKPQDIPPERIGVSAKAAAEMLGVCERTIWNLAKANKIRSVRIGKRVIVSVQSLRELVDGTSTSCNLPAFGHNEPWK